MKILFLLLQKAEEGQGSNMYTDLIEEFHNNGHDVTIMAPSNNGKTYKATESKLKVIRVNALPTQNIKNLIRKGVGLAMLPYFFKKAYKQHLRNQEFDWIIMPTPPITLVDFVTFVKKETQAKFYLILRDIHPQSAASIGLIKNKQMYNYLERRASKGYHIADKIGCMSQGNIDFIRTNYPSIDPEKVVLLYNWQKESKQQINGEDDIRKKYNLDNKIVALFGGTIGYGQRVENLYDLAKHYRERKKVVFLIVGRGVEKDRLELMAKEENLTNMMFLDFLPRDDYLTLVSSADIGLISINENYKVPTCPSKAVAYMALGIPVFAMINPNSDYGDFIQNSGAGYWAVGNDKENVYNNFDKIASSDALRKQMSKAGRAFYLKELTSEVAFKTMINQMR
jgi:glycosyltransferase involved in cell wall biosynthesis